MLSPLLVAQLSAHKARQQEKNDLLGNRWQDIGLVCTNENGAAIHPQNLAHRFKRLVKAAGVPMIRPYDLRHTATSVMIAGGADPKAVSEVLGHADPGLTMRVYYHTQTEQRDNAIRLLAGALEPVDAADTTPTVHAAPTLKLVTEEAS